MTHRESTAIAHKKVQNLPRPKLYFSGHLCTVNPAVPSSTITPFSPQLQKKATKTLLWPHHPSFIYIYLSRTIIKYQDPSSKIIQDSLTSPMVSVREPQLRTTANSNRMATRMAINEDGITLKICNGTWNAGRVPSGLRSLGFPLKKKLGC